MKKTFNIGEYSYYGRWQIEIKGESIIVRGIDWDTRKVKQTDTFRKQDIGNYRLENHLTDVSTVYWAGKMMEWVKSKVPDWQPAPSGSWL